MAPTEADGGGLRTADLPVPSAPRVSTRALLVLVGALLLLLLGGLVVSLVLLHQPALTPVPVPSVSQL